MVRGGWNPQVSGYGLLLPAEDAASPSPLPGSPKDPNARTPPPKILIRRLLFRLVGIGLAALHAPLFKPLRKPALRLLVLVLSFGQ